MAKRYQRGNENPYIKKNKQENGQLITPLVSFGHCVVCSSLYTDADYPFGVFKLFLAPFQERHVTVKMVDRACPEVERFVIRC
jgi:hypothetical protein